MNTEQIDALWKTPSNWTAGLFYHCKEDPRLIVYKRQKWQGWTVNFSRPMAIPSIILTLAIAILPFKIARSVDFLTQSNQYIFLACVIVVIVALWTSILKIQKKN